MVGEGTLTLIIKEYKVIVDQTEGDVNMVPVVNNNNNVPSIIIESKVSDKTQTSSSLQNSTYTLKTKSTQ